MNVNVATIAAMLAAFSLASAAQTEIPMEKVAAGERSAIAAAREVVVRNEAEWQQLWSEHGSRQPIPRVDFQTRIVVGVFLGTRPTSGFSVRIVEVREELGILRVRYSARDPSPGAMVLQVLTSPFDLVSVPRRTADVQFERVPDLPRPIR